jgi:hypothetical protein
VPEAMLAMIEEIPSLETQGTKINDAIALIAQKVTPLKLLSKSEEEEEEEERIASVMSSFFNIDEEGLEEKDTTDTILVPKGVTPHAADVVISTSSKVELTPAVVTPSSIIMAEEKVCSSKPMLAEDKVKGPAKSKESKKAIEDGTPLGVGPFVQDLGVEGIEFTMLLGRLWVQSS